MNHADITPI